jgi:ATP-binding cassette subfamily B protein
MIVFLTVVSVLASVVIPLLTRQMTLDITNKIAQSMPNYVRNSDFWGLG